MLMGYVEARKNQDQQKADDVNEPKGHWVSCPDIPDGLLTVDDDLPYQLPRSSQEVDEQ